MNLDELQSVQSRERQTDSLQQLRESFYADAGEFIQGLREERDHAAERADDPFDAPEVNRLTDDIKTAEQTVEAIYERRVGKIVKMASLAAADMPAEEEGLTREERDLFETLVGAIEDNRDHVLDVLAGETATGAVASGSGDATASNPTPGPTEPEESAPAEPAPAADPASEGGPTAESDPEQTAEGTGVDAADVMGADQERSADEIPPPPPEEPPEDASPRAEVANATDESAPPDAGSDPTPGAGDAGGDSATGVDADAGSDAGPDVERTTVRITDDVGEIFGVDQREYDLSTDDVVTLPEENAAPLVKRDAAERLE
ncbi:DNA replication complex subunit Gins51 [Halomicrobium urmianum]|uniref:DNA replication complex subunit Gins51 n=1 Tax=Halomicrobium urmianum TaxID=1586233 RepID=UPI001CDA0B30|nr:hypothetical protein [Halomicrobium urmianum]